MSKQEEIRERIAIFVSRCGYRQSVSLNNCDACIAFDEENVLCKDPTADVILSYLNSQGAVLKVERELPCYPITEPEEDELEVYKLHNEGYISGWIAMGNKMLEAGYVATEPLIEESK